MKCADFLYLTSCLLFRVPKIPLHLPVSLHIQQVSVVKNTGLISLCDIGNDQGLWEVSLSFAKSFEVFKLSTNALDLVTFHSCLLLTSSLVSRLVCNLSYTTELDAL